MRETFPWGTHHVYDRTAGRVFRHVFDDLAGQRPGARRILDLGCGPGHLAAMLATTHPEADVLGMDIDARQIRIAGRRRGDRARFEVGAAHDLPLADSSRDWIIATETFHHWRSPEASLREMRRVLEAEGEAWIVEPAGDMTREELATWTRLHRIPGLLGLARRVASEHGYTTRRLEEELVPMAEHAGFAVEAKRQDGWWRVVLTIG